jgi:outer membrane protein assembly factor BamD (BamD/ComL family)
MADGSWSKARRQLDALVRQWPTSQEAPKAQQTIAEIYLDNLHDVEDAFAAYRYLLDFYSLSCDYGKIADKLYQVANLMKSEGKEVMFIRFANTVDVRRAFEACVLRAPGASWVPEAMLTIGALREDEGKYGEAAKVYENLRNIHPGSDQAKSAWLREAEVRMILLREHAYNRSRCRDTIDFLKLAITGCRPPDVVKMQEFLAEAQNLVAEEEWRATKFYDSPTRTRRSAVSAYEKFLAEHPDSAHAGEARARLAELKEGSK